MMDDPEDTTAAIDRDQKLHAIGWQMTDERMKEIYGAGYERVAPPAPPGAAPGEPPATDPPPAGFAEGDAHDSAIDDLAQRLIADGRAAAAAAPLLADVEAMLADLPEIGTLEALRERLDRLEAEGGDAALLADLLGRAALAARGAGELGAPVEDGELPSDSRRLPGARRP